MNVPEPPDRPLRIAVAADPDMRKYLQEVLPRLGHEVCGAAASGTELTALCSRLEPDLVIADIKLPDADGLEAARSVNEGRPTPFVLVADYHDLPLVERALQAFVLAYVIKPIRREDVAVAVTLAARRSQDFRALRQEAAELRQSLEDRKLVERAKGIVTRRLGIAEDDAFRRLRRHSCDRNLKLVEVAREVLVAEGIFQALDGVTPPAEAARLRPPSPYSDGRRKQHDPTGGR